jgi:uncharacterized DUF497 family protein
MAGATFEWDLRNDLVNRLKHRVSFVEAQAAFADPKRVIAEDSTHGGEEPRWFCMGKAGGGIMTVRFTWREPGHPHLRCGLLEKRKGDL